MRTAASAAAARPRMNAKNCGDCPVNRPMRVKNARVFMATRRVSVGRMIEHFGSLRLMKGQGSGMIKLVVKVSPPNLPELRSGKVNPLVGSVSGAIGAETAAPALSDHV